MQQGLELKFNGQGHSGILTPSIIPFANYFLEQIMDHVKFGSQFGHRKRSIFSS